MIFVKTTLIEKRFGPYIDQVFLGSHVWTGRRISNVKVLTIKRSVMGMMVISREGR